MPDTASSTAPPGTLLLDDGLGRNGCRCPAYCRDVVGWFRESVACARRFNVQTVPMTPSELAAVPTVAKQVGVYAMATLDLDAYTDAHDVMKAARSITTKRGTVNRQIARALRHGYTVREFQPGDHLSDMVAIHRSKAFRDRKPMEGAFYLADVNALANMIQPGAAEFCTQHNERFWGVFREAAEHADGDRLVGYICLTRLGNSAIYRHVMGHGDYLRHGIMYFLHYEVVATLLKKRPAGLRYLTYGAYARRPLDPPTHWKRLALFEPHYLLYADDYGVSLPAEPPMPGIAEGLLAVKQTLDEAWPQALETAAQFGVSAEWLGILHRAWVVESARAPGLLMQILRGGPHPALEVLRPLASNLFPMEVLDGIDSVLTILEGDSRGLDTLLPLHDRGLQRVKVVHGQDTELDALRETYPRAWTYAARTDALTIDDAALWIMEPSQPEQLTHAIKSWAESPGRRLLIAASEIGLLTIDCPAPIPKKIAACFSGIARMDVVCRGVFFRHGAPEQTYWVWTDKVR